MPLFTGDTQDNTIFGTYQNDTIFGLSGDDVLFGGGLLYGGAGLDRLEGGNDADTLYGGSGDDTLSPTAGADVLYGGPGQEDEGSFFGLPAVVIDLVKSFRNDGPAKDQEYFEIEVIKGTDNDDYIGGDEQDNYLLGYDGDDTIDGRSGNNFLDGWAGDDKLIVDGGNDTLRGWSGDDTLIGRGGDDLFFGGIGQDRFFGGSGQDTADYTHQSEASGAVRVDLKSNNNSGAAQGDRLFGIESVIATDDNDYLGGNGKANAFFGGTGKDTLDGRWGDDTLFGGDGDDRLIADGDDDLFFGGAGEDTLTSRGGDDTLIGGSGDDVLKGGSGRDTFGYYQADNGSDVIKDFDLAEDVLVVEGVTFGTGPGETDPQTFLSVVGQIEGRDVVLNVDSSTTIRLQNVFAVDETPDLSLLVSALQGTGNVDLELYETQDADIFGTSQDDLLSAPNVIMDANDPVSEARLFGLAGDDTLVGSGSNDTMTGGSGDDVFRFPLDDTYGSLPGDDVITDFEIGSDLVEIFPSFPTDEASIRSYLQSEASIENGTDLLVALTTPLNMEGTLLLENVVTAGTGDEEDYWEIFV